MPAAAVIPSPMAFIKVVAFKKARSCWCCRVSYIVEVLCLWSVVKAVNRTPNTSLQVCFVFIGCVVKLFVVGVFS